MAKELKEILSECIREAGSIEDLAERLISAGVTFAPRDNAECEIRNAELRVAEKIFAEIEAIPVENVPYAVYLNIHNKIAELKKKYTEGKR